MDQYTKDFWNEIIKEKDKHIFINGKSYMLGNEKDKYKAFDGDRFDIKMLDTGEEITTTNLWYQGEIPSEFKAKLPNTAEFI